MPKLNPEKPSVDFSFIGVIMNREKKKIPGPTTYNPFSTESDPKKIKFYTAKSKGDSFFENLQKEGKKVPGVGSYATEGQKRKILGLYNFDKGKEHGGPSSFDDAIFKGKTIPAPYQAVELDKIRDRIIPVNIFPEAKTVSRVIKKAS